jgi:general secretion pathway protein L
MNKRYIGLDIGARRTLMVVLEYTKDELVAVSYQESHQETLEEQLSELRKDIAGEFHAGDRVIAALPACKAFVRDLEFPFTGMRKIAAALPLALNIQIPIPVESCATAFFFGGQSVEDSMTRVKAAAVPSEALRGMLEAAEQVRIPVHIVDLSPFASVDGLTQQLNDALLILSDDQETTVSLVCAGKLIDYRLIPGGTNQQNEDKAVVVEREIKALLRNAGERRDLPIFLAGEAGHYDLIRLLSDQELEVQELALDLGGEEIPAAFVPAAALALRATGHGGNSFNFRHGEFGIRGEWQKFRKPLLCTAGLLLLALLLLVATAVMLLQAKNDQIDVLQTRVNNIYRETFPGATVIVDAPKQMEAALRGLQEQSELLGGVQVGVLPLLKTVSDLPESLNVVFQELTYGINEARISGSADSFEQVNQLADHLSGSPLFAEVRVADAKMSVQGDNVSFRLLLAFAGTGRVQ